MDSASDHPPSWPRIDLERHEHSRAVVSALKSLQQRILRLEEETAEGRKTTEQLTAELERRRERYNQDREIRGISEAEKDAAARLSYERLLASTTATEAQLACVNQQTAEMGDALAEARRRARTAEDAAAAAAARLVVAERSEADATKALESTRCGERIAVTAVAAGGAAAAATGIGGEEEEKAQQARALGRRLERLQAVLATEKRRRRTTERRAQKTAASGALTEKRMQEALAVNTALSGVAAGVQEDHLPARTGGGSWGSADAVVSGSTRLFVRQSERPLAAERAGEPARALASGGASAFHSSAEAHEHYGGFNGQREDRRGEWGGNAVGGTGATSWDDGAPTWSDGEEAEGEGDGEGEASRHLNHHYDLSDAPPSREASALAEQHATVTLTTNRPEPPISPPGSASPPPSPSPLGTAAFPPRPHEDAAAGAARAASTAARKRAPAGPSRCHPGSGEVLRSACSYSFARGPPPSATTRRPGAAAKARAKAREGIGKTSKRVESKRQLRKVMDTVREDCRLLEERYADYLHYCGGASDRRGDRRVGKEDATAAGDVAAVVQALRRNARRGLDLATSAASRDSGMGAFSEGWQQPVQQQPPPQQQQQLQPGGDKSAYSGAGGVWSPQSMRRREAAVSLLHARLRA